MTLLFVYAKLACAYMRRTKGGIYIGRTYWVLYRMCFGMAATTQMEKENLIWFL